MTEVYVVAEDYAFTPLKLYFTRCETEVYISLHNQQMALQQDLLGLSETIHCVCVYSVHFVILLWQCLELNFSKTGVYIKILTESLGMYKRKQDMGGEKK